MNKITTHVAVSLVISYYNLFLSINLKKKMSVAILLHAMNGFFSSLLISIGFEKTIFV